MYKRLNDYVCAYATEEAPLLVENDKKVLSKGEVQNNRGVPSLNAIVKQLSLSLSLFLSDH